MYIPFPLTLSKFRYFGDNFKWLAYKVGVSIFNANQSSTTQRMTSDNWSKWESKKLSKDVGPMVHRTTPPNIFLKS